MRGRKICYVSETARILEQLGFVKVRIHVPFFPVHNTGCFGKNCRISWRMPEMM